MTKKKVLYVEDELFLGKIVKESLETRGYEVTMEGDGAKVQALYSSVNPDICILDIMLPNKDGFTIAEEIRNMNNRVPIIFLTAKVQTEDVLNGFSKGGNDYIRKPFSMEELIVRIENLLRIGAEHTQAPELHKVKIGDYTFFLNRQLLVKDTDARKLSFRESELLKLLYTNRDRVIDRRDILNLLWGSDSFFNSRNLDVYVTRLRSYLREDPTLEVITIKGIGYRFVCS